MSLLDGFKKNALFDPEIFFSDIENKLAAARRFFNSTTREFNNACEVFPSNIIAGMFNFKRAAMYEATENRETLEKAPEVKF